MSPAEYNALQELLGEYFGYFLSFFIGNLPFLIPLSIGLYWIHRRFKRSVKAKKLDPPE